MHIYYMYMPGYSHSDQELSIHSLIFVENITLLVQILAMSLAHL